VAVRPAPQTIRTTTSAAIRSAIGSAPRLRRQSFCATRRPQQHRL
jgi:hypothetical protein